MVKEFKAALFDELEALYPDTKVENGEKCYTIATANNSYGGVHVLLTGLKVGSFISLETINPQNIFSTGQFGDYKFFEMIALPVEVNSGAETRVEWTFNDVNPHVIRRAPFMIYDVLKPCPNVLKVTSEVMALGFRFKVDIKENTIQKWELMIHHEAQTQRLTVINEGFKVTIPKVSKEDHMYVNWFGDKKIAESHQIKFLSAQWYAMYEKYLKLGVYGRQNMASLQMVTIFDYDGMNTPVLNKEKLDKIIEIYDRVGIYWIEGPHLIGRLHGNWEATTAETTLSKEVIPGAGEKELEIIASQLYEYIQGNELEERWIQSVMDEPVDGLADTYNIAVSIVKKAMPNIKISDATIARETIEDSIDIWCPTLDKYEKYQSFFDDQVINKNKEVFVYSCLNPAGAYCNRFLDQERLRPVYLGWAPMKYSNVTGFLHWGGMNLLDANPYYTSHIIADVDDYGQVKSGDLPAGDSAIMYPGYMQVYSSTRLEAQRIGLEDLFLLTKLKESKPEKCDELVAQVFRSYTDIEKDIRVYRAIKQNLLTILSKE